MAFNYLPPLVRQLFYLYRAAGMRDLFPDAVDNRQTGCPGISAVVQMGFSTGRVHLSGVVPVGLEIRRPALPLDGKLSFPVDRHFVLN